MLANNSTNYRLQDIDWSLARCKSQRHCPLVSRAFPGPFKRCLAVIVVSAFPRNNQQVIGTYSNSRQISDALGILCGFLSWLAISHSTQSTEAEARWRILTLTTLIPTIPLLVAAYMVPESYIFLMKTRRYSKAAEAACLYRKSRLQGFRDLLASHFQMEAEGELMKMRKDQKNAECHLRDEENTTSNRSDPLADRSNEAFVDETKPLKDRLPGVPPGVCLGSYTTTTSPARNGEILGGARRVKCPHRYHMKEIHFFQRLWQIFEDARCRRALLSSGVAMEAQALCGINAFAFFSSSLVNTGIDPSVSMALATAFGGVSFGFGLLTPLLSDRLGRTTLMLLGLPVMSVLMFILATLFELENSARTPVIVLVRF
jgi:Sugar (and other) transporter